MLPGRRPPRGVRRRRCASGCAPRACASEVDARGESVGRRIRDGELAKVPYLLVVGDREAEAGTASARARGHGGTSARSPLDELAERLADEARSG